MQKLYTPFFIALLGVALALPSLVWAAAVQPQPTQAVPAAFSVGNQQELSEYLYLRNKLSKGASLEYIITHSLGEVVKLVGSAFFGGVITELVKQYAQNGDANSLRTLIDQAESGVAGGLALLMYVIIFNNLPFLQSTLTLQPHAVILENFISNWHTHRSNIPLQYRFSFDALYDYYQKNGCRLQATENESKRVLSYLLSKCDEYINNAASVRVDAPADHFFNNIDRDRLITIQEVKKESSDEADVSAGAESA